ncbi:MAG: response regulator [Pseudomonas sp.]|nr:response regulator [Pseudomonas sp.]
MFSKLKNKNKVVIIDDVETNLLILSSSLRANGLSNIITFSNSKDGLDWLLLNPWGLVLLDLNMPTPNGLEILECLRERDRAEFPIIIITGFNDPKERRSGLDKGANDFISKPFDMPEVLLRVRGCLELAQSARELRETNCKLERKVELRTAQLECSYSSAINTLCRAAAYRDDDTGDHIHRIGDSAALLAQAIGMPSHWYEMMRVAAPMHDVGKIGIEDAILQKTGKLTPAERKIMQEHARIGYEILYDPDGSPVTHLAAEIALRHHERWDGSGYPDGYRCEEIPLSARIVAVCDVYDALRMTRPYKKAWSVECSKNYIIEQAGSHFDPSLTDVFCNLIDEIEVLRSSNLKF